eukprot:gnl/TRDRNA2_/TRDRNA2_172446_c1_seq9.p1 gnl/TRDRNA2_/TRDRNA2_172446_c1~~gnl/TRDRNA2_/TRDRNA2_172446_c1_seq9.p1  ORF type:complete len:678 (-),score=67.07 gnl/TRDRNA2_/TRDRNA2_172446_c1_seq9:41-2074(-)
MGNPAALRQEAVRTASMSSLHSSTTPWPRVVTNVQQAAYAPPHSNIISLPTSSSWVPAISPQHISSSFPRGRGSSPPPPLKAVEFQSSTKAPKLQSRLEPPQKPQISITVEHIQINCKNGQSGSNTPSNAVGGTTPPPACVQPLRFNVSTHPQSAVEPGIPCLPTSASTGQLSEIPHANTTAVWPDVQSLQTSTCTVQPAYDEVVSIMGNQYGLLEVVGRGSYGTVRRAREVSDAEASDIAVKSVVAKNTRSYLEVTFEAEVLKMLTAKLPPTSKSHVSNYIAHDVSRSMTPGECGSMKLAMSFAVGGPLDQWLYGINQDEQKTISPMKLIDGHLPGGQQDTRSLADTCCVVRAILLQLSSVFEYLQPIAFHRDVSSHNILISFPTGVQSGCPPHLALIDFGFAVRSGSWGTEYEKTNVSGDPRYWTPSAWMAMAFGFKYMVTHPNAGFKQQYLTRIDHFSLGIVGLEMLMGLMARSEASCWRGLSEVRAAWSKFWVIAITYFQMVHKKGGKAVCQLLAQSKDHGVVDFMGRLNQLRRSLRFAAIQPGNEQYKPILLILSDLIDEKGTLTWKEVPKLLHETGGPDSVVADREPKSVSTEHRSLEFQPTHRRIRSTGDTMERELMRTEPEISSVVDKFGSAPPAVRQVVPTPRIPGSPRLIPMQRCVNHYSHARHASM